MGTNFARQMVFTTPVDPASSARPREELYLKGLGYRYD